MPSKAFKALCRNHRLKISRDEDGTGIVRGRLGHLFEYGPKLIGLVFLPTDRSDDLPDRRWGHVKRKLLSSMRVVLDGDREGVIVFSAYDAKAWEVAIRCVRARRKRRYSDETLARLKQRGQELAQKYSRN